MTALTDYERWVLSNAADGWALADLLCVDQPADVAAAVARIQRKLDATSFEHAVQIYRTQEQP